MSMQGITRDYIRNSHHIFSDLCEYVVEIQISGGESMIGKLPIGLRRILLIVNMDSEIYNGGFQQYFANKTYDGKIGEAVTVDAEVVDAIDALKVMGAVDVAELAEKAFAAWNEFISTCSPGQNNDDAWNKMESTLDHLDDLYYQLSSQMESDLEKYILLHEDEFLHST